MSERAEDHLRLPPAPKSQEPNPSGSAATTAIGMVQAGHAAANTAHGNSHSRSIASTNTVTRL